MTSRPSRRSAPHSWLVAAALLAAATRPAVAQATAALTAIAPGTWLARDPAGNVVVAIGMDGAVVVGPQTLAAQPALRHAIERIAPVPVRFVVVAASPIIEASRDAGWGRAGSVVIAEEHAALRMANGMKSAGRDAASTPTLGFSEVQQIHLADEDIHVVRQAPGSTDADISAHFESHGVLYLGSAFTADRYPVIDEAHGGSFDGLVETAAKFMTFGARTKIVPGSGDLATTGDLRAYHDMLVAIRDRVKALKVQGKSLDAIVATHPTAPYDARWGRVDGAGRALVVAAYHSIAGPARKR